MNYFLALSAFASGALYECGCTFWVRYCEQGRAGRATLISMFNAVTTLVGIGESVKDWRIAPFYIVGYGVGTYATVKWLGDNS